VFRVDFAFTGLVINIHWIGDKHSLDWW